MTGIDVGAIKDLLKDFDTRIAERRAAEDEIAKLEATLITRRADLATLQGNIADATTRLTELHRAIETAEADKEAHIRLTTELDHKREEHRRVSAELPKLTKEEKDLREKVSTLSSELATLTESVTKVFKEMKREGDALTARKASLLKTQAQLETQNQAEAQKLQADRDDLAKERADLAKLRKECDIKLSRIQYSAKTMPDYARGIQKQFDDLGLKLDFLKMLDKVNGVTK